MASRSIGASAAAPATTTPRKSTRTSLGTPPRGAGDVSRSAPSPKGTPRTESLKADAKKATEALAKHLAIRGVEEKLVAIHDAESKLLRTAVASAAKLLGEAEKADAKTVENAKRKKVAAAKAAEDERAAVAAAKAPKVPETPEVPKTGEPTLPPREGVLPHEAEAPAVIRELDEIFRAAVPVRGLAAYGALCKHSVEVDGETTPCGQPNCRVHPATHKDQDKDYRASGLKQPYLHKKSCEICKGKNNLRGCSLCLHQWCDSADCAPALVSEYYNTPCRACHAVIATGDKEATDHGREIDDPTDRDETALGALRALSYFAALHRSAVPQAQGTGGKGDEEDGKPKSSTKNGKKIGTEDDGVGENAAGGQGNNAKATESGKDAPSKGGAWNEDLLAKLKNRDNLTDDEYDELCNVVKAMSEEEPEGQDQIDEQLRIDIATELSQAEADEEETKRVAKEAIIAAKEAKAARMKLEARVLVPGRQDGNGKPAAQAGGPAAQASGARMLQYDLTRDDTASEGGSKGSAETKPAMSFRSMVQAAREAVEKVFDLKASDRANRIAISDVLGNFWSEEEAAAANSKFRPKSTQLASDHNKLSKETEKRLEAGIDPCSNLSKHESSTLHISKIALAKLVKRDALVLMRGKDPFETTTDKDGITHSSATCPGKARNHLVWQRDSAKALLADNYERGASAPAETIRALHVLSEQLETLISVFDRHRARFEESYPDETAATSALFLTMLSRNTVFEAERVHELLNNPSMNGEQQLSEQERIDFSQMARDQHLETGSAGAHHAGPHQGGGRGGGGPGGGGRGGGPTPGSQPAPQRWQSSHSAPGHDCSAHPPKNNTDAQCGRCYELFPDEPLKWKHSWLHECAGGAPSKRALDTYYKRKRAEQAEAHAKKSKR
jgi:hypothetical protein